MRVSVLRVVKEVVISLNVAGSVRHVDRKEGLPFHNPPQTFELFHCHSITGD